MKERYSGSTRSGKRKAPAPVPRQPEGCQWRTQEGQVTVQVPLPMLEELAGTYQYLEQLARNLGLTVAQAIMEDEATRRLTQTQEGTEPVQRWGHEVGSIFFNGEKVRLSRPRLRQGQQEVPLASYQLLRGEGNVQESVQGQVVRGVSTRGFGASLGQSTDYGVKRSSVSRKFVLASRRQLAELCSRSLEKHQVAVLIIDGKTFDKHMLVVAIGIDREGRKHVLGLWEGATENATVCQGLLDDLLSRGLDSTQILLALLDGSKALAKAVRHTFGKDQPIQRCQVHKKRNVGEHLPAKWQGEAKRRLSVAYGMTKHAEALAALQETVVWLRQLSEGAARSLEEGLEETITLHRLEVPPVLRGSLSSTNVIESCFGRVEELTRQVKRWRNAEMVLRWAGTMLLEAEKSFRRVRGYQHLPWFLARLEAARAKRAPKAARA